MNNKPMINQNTTTLRGILAAKLPTRKTKSGQSVANVLVRIPGETRRVVELAGFGSTVASLKAAKEGSEMIMVVRNLATQTYVKNGTEISKEKGVIVRYDYMNKLDHLAAE